MKAVKRKDKSKKAKKVVGHIDPRRRVMENPYFAPEHPLSDGNLKFITVTVNAKESAVETLFARKFLGEAQKKAADKFRGFWEAAGGKASSLDYSLDRVDGGRGDPVVTKIRAAQELARVRHLLGQRGYELIQSVCGEGRSLSEITPHKRERLTMADNLRADLDDLACMWGLMTARKIERYSKSRSVGVDNGNRI